MAAGVPARLSAADGRRFGLTVGIAFLVFAALAWWREHPTASLILGAIGTALTVSALAAPTRLELVHNAWMRLAVVISKVTTPILLGVIYFGLFAPLGALVRVAGHRPLARDRSARTYWVPHRSPAEGHGGMERQF